MSINRVKLFVLFVALGIVVVIASSTALPQESQNSESEIKKAVIIDQLYNDFPNEEFHQNATRILNGSGYQVDIYTTSDLVFDFYKKLPSKNYEFILFRTHGLHETVLEDSASLFTGEIYNPEKYRNEQILGHLNRGVTVTQEVIDQVGWAALVNKTYFTFGSTLVDQAMVGKFPQSTIIIGGCDALSGPLLADSLIARGASTVVGWDGLVSSSDNDTVILSFLEEYLDNGLETEQAVAKATEDLKSDRIFDGNLVYQSSKMA